MNNLCLNQKVNARNNTYFGEIIKVCNPNGATLYVVKTLEGMELAFFPAEVKFITEEEYFRESICQ